MAQTSAATTGRKSRGRQNEKPPVPREHGAWFVLFGSLIIGAAAGGRLGVEWVLVVAAALLLFLAREPLAKLWRTRGRSVAAERRRGWLRWLAVEVGLGLAAGFVLVIGFQRWALLAFAAIGAGLFLLHLSWSIRRQDRTLGAELLGTVGLTAAAPASVAALDQGGLELWLTVWLACILYFASGVFFVRMRIAGAMRPAEWPRNRRLNLIYHLLLGGFVAADLTAGILPAGAWIGFVPVVVRGLVYCLIPPRGPLNIRALGYTEVAYSAFFVAVQVFAWTR